MRHKLSNALLTKCCVSYHFVYAYIDDLLVASSSSEEHYSHLKHLFRKLDEYGVDKYVFGVGSVEFLGHYVSTDGIVPLPAKIKAITDFPVPNSLRQLRRYLGLINFYRRFVPSCAYIIQPLAGCPKVQKAKQTNQPRGD